MSPRAPAVFAKGIFLSSTSFSIYEADGRRPAQGDLDTWKSQISIRSLTEVASTQPAQDLLSKSLAPLLCYSCQGTLMSRSSKSVPVGEGGRIVSLPVWTRAKLVDRARMRGEIQEFLIEDDGDDGE